MAIVHNHVRCHVDVLATVITLCTGGYTIFCDGLFK